MARPTAALRVVRLMALLEVLAAGTDALTEAWGVRRFMRYATVWLAASTTPTPPSLLARPPAVSDLEIVRLGPAMYVPAELAHIENASREHASGMKVVVFSA